MSQLFMYNPNFNNYLYSKYYATASNVVFTKEEKEYIASNPTVKVLVDPIWYPIESYDEKTDMITLITDKDIMSKGCKVLDLETMQMVEEIPVRKDCKNKLEVLEIKK